MKILRILLFPIVPIYFVITWLRNKLYDFGYKTSQSYDFPVICVGNLSTGGTGKTPMIEYLIRLLSNKSKVATLSRGYKRVTKGFVLADENSNVDTLGDEPFQFYNKFKNIYVAVDEDRQNGISELRKLKNSPEIVLLDDAYQHRKVKAGFNVLMTSYSNLFTKDMVLPTGNLREPRYGYKRANAIVVTKCPANLDDSEKTKIKKSIKPKSNQKVFFSSISYSDTVFSFEEEKQLKEFDDFTLVTGIANATPLVSFLKSKGHKFSHIEFGDHHNFTLKDLELLEKQEKILTTEKDYMRLMCEEQLRSKLYYIPIEILIDDFKAFNSSVLSFVD